MDGGTGVKTIIYNTKKDSKGKKKKEKGKKKEREKERKRVKKYNNKKEEFSTLSHSTRTGPSLLLACVCM